MVRVLVAAPQPFYQDRGTPIAVLHLVKSFSELGYQVDLVCFPLGQTIPLPGLRYIRIANPLGFRHIPVGFSFRKVFLDILLFFKLRSLLKAREYDCVHAVEEAAFLAVAAARRYGVPVVYDMQSSMAEQMAYCRFPGARLCAPFWRAAEGWLTRQVSFVGASAGLGPHAASLNPGARVWEWEYPGEGYRPRRAEPAKLRRELKIGERQPVVMYTGTFEQYQGLDMLAEAVPQVLKLIPEAVFVFIGGKIGDCARLERILSREVPLGGYRLLARQPKQLIPDLLRMADILVSPRFYGKNLPLKIIEYLSACRPIVATGIPAHRALLNDQLAELTGVSAPALAAGIIRVLTDPQRAAALKAAARDYAANCAGCDRFSWVVQDIYGQFERQPQQGRMTGVSVIIPARNAAVLIGKVVSSVRSQQVPQGVDLEVMVVDDNSTDATVRKAQEAGARIVPMPRSAAGGNPAAVRNRGARQARGELLVFLDADCLPQDGWLSALLASAGRGAVCVGGSLALPPGLGLFGRLDYYCGWYHVHPRRPQGVVSHHPPGNLCVRRDVFLKTRGFTESYPVAYAHEELIWQDELLREGRKIFFEPRAAAWHYNREGCLNFLRRNFRWGYSAIESKAAVGTTRFSGLYRYPLLVIAAAPVLAPLSAVYIIACWLRAGVFVPLLFFPAVLAARVSYAVGMMIGGARWLMRRKRKGQS